MRYQLRNPLKGTKPSLTGAADGMACVPLLCFSLATHMMPSGEAWCLRSRPYSPELVEGTFSETEFSEVRQEFIEHSLTHPSPTVSYVSHPETPLDAYIRSTKRGPPGGDGRAGAPKRLYPEVSGLPTGSTGAGAPKSPGPMIPTPTSLRQSPRSTRR